MRVLAVGCAVASLSCLVPPVWALCDYFNYTLDAQQVVPAAQGVTGSGWSELHLCDDDSLRGYVGLSITETVTAVHIHGPSQPTENGNLLYELPLPDHGYVAVRLGGVLAYRNWLVLDQCYVDVHTTAHPDGAIRGVMHGEIAVSPSAWGAVKQLYR